MIEPTRKIARQATSAVAFTTDEPDADDPLLSFEPFLHKAPRRNSITPGLQRRFVAALAATGIVKLAAKRIGKSLEALYKLRARPGAEGFAAAWDAALERGVQRLEDIALERAMLGTRTPIVSGGEILGHWDKPDNALLRFLLQHRLPERYGVQDLKPGHPVYESIRAEVLAEQEPLAGAGEAEVLASLNAKLEHMRANEDALAAMDAAEKRERLREVGAQAMAEVRARSGPK
ncbi:hypothetical protein EKJ_21330 [Qipengyuania flava]|uniref:Terminase small subunit n=1 Tax=Qipengyuania flava TaxID=192812 RepID=A0A3T1CJV8_9SPHN|nr:hypothetical protein [Qipengyuania flava]BBI21286.1 hypothetical protein EKJ_21330 [Qipengyuania flava]